MIIYTSLLRQQDSLPLCITTDFSKVSESKVQESKRVIKLLSKQLQKYSNKLCVQGEDFTIHCMRDESVFYIIVCEANYPYILAYSFIDELMKEFSLLYTPSVVNTVRRPFAFLEFDSYLQKVQQKYNSSRSLAARINLPNMTNDFNLNPPTYLSVSDLEPPKPLQNGVNSGGSSIDVNSSNGSIPNGHLKVHDSPDFDNIKLQMKPVPWYGRLALIFAFPCVVLDAYRGLVSLESFNLEDNDGPTLIHGLAFLMEMALFCVQIYFLKHFSGYRKLVTLLCFVSVVSLNFVIGPLREHFIVAIYLTVSFLIFFATVKRTFEKCLPRWNI